MLAGKMMGFGGKDISDGKQVPSMRNEMTIFPFCHET